MEMDISRLALRFVTTPEDWQAFHSIRRTVLFEPYGYEYDENHPDDHNPNNAPMLLELDSTPIGAMRVDLVPNRQTAIMRTVGMVSEQQHLGYGRVFLSLAEQYARDRGCEEACVVAAKWAVGFYAKCGYQEDLWDPQHVPKNGRQMRKKLTTRIGR